MSGERATAPGGVHVVEVRHDPDSGHHPFHVECSCLGLVVDVAEHRVGPSIVTHLYQTDDSAKGAPDGA